MALSFSEYNIGASFLFGLLLSGGAGVLIFAVPFLVVIFSFMLLAVYILWLFFAGFQDGAASLLIFIIFLPIVNAVMDYSSLSASRLLLTRKSKNSLSEDKIAHSVPVTLLFVLLDGLTAIGFMFVIAGLLAAGVAFVNVLVLFAGGISIDWRFYVQSAVDSPLRDGVFVTAMLITTLLPTIVHAFLGSVLVSLSGPLAIPAYARILRGGAKAPPLHRLLVVLGFMFALGAGVLTVYIVLSVGYSIVAVWGKPLANALADFAFTVGHRIEYAFGVPPSVF